MRKYATESDKARHALVMDRIREEFPRGTVIYLVSRGVSESGMSERITPIMVKDGIPYSIVSAVANALGVRPCRDGSIRIHGCNLDRGHHMVETFAYHVHGDADAFVARWLIH